MRKVIGSLFSSAGTSSLAVGVRRVCVLGGAVIACFLWAQQGTVLSSDTLRARAHSIGTKVKYQHAAAMVVAACPVSSVSKRDISELTSIFTAVNEASARYDLDHELLFAVISAESRCRKSARSSAGAMGLMQLMPITAKHLGVAEPYAVRANIMGGAKYLAELLREFNGDVELALAAYNAGPVNVKRYGGIPPFKETRGYVSKVLSVYDDLVELTSGTDITLEA